MVSFPIEEEVTIGTTTEAEIGLILEEMVEVEGAILTSFIKEIQVSILNIKTELVAPVKMYMLYMFHNNFFIIMLISRTWNAMFYIQVAFNQL